MYFHNHVAKFGKSIGMQLLIAVLLVFTKLGSVFSTGVSIVTYASRFRVPTQCSQHDLTQKALIILTTMKPNSLPL